jgi:hypothetical protein
MSDHTRRMVDEEQQYLTDLAHRRAMTIVGDNRELLDALANTLLENEVLEREDIERLVAEHRTAPAAPTIGRFAPLEPGPATVAASKRIEGQPGEDSPS